LRRVRDVRATLTPQLDLSQPSRLLLSIWAEARTAWEDHAGLKCTRRAAASRRILDSPDLLLALFAAMVE